MVIPSNREIRCELARRSFWHFCKLLAPDFYKDDRGYLKTLCDTLQNLYEGTLIAKDGKPFRNLIIEIPPRHGKSRTLTNFSAWVLGKKHTNKIITASFNDDLAQDFSRFTRDIISEEKNLQEDIVYSDIFDARIKKGDAAAHKWALDGQYFNYKGCGIGGSITGKGGNILIIDDPVKDAETAYNENALEKIWLWYTGTLIQRSEKAIKILCMTPWSKKDLGGRLREKQGDKWHVLTMPVMSDGEMLCEDIMTAEEYEEMKSIGDANIISANYDLVRLDVKGQLYQKFNTYDELPEQTEGNIGYTDTADEGSDYLCSIQGKKKGNYIYVTDVIYTQEPQEKTEILVSDSIQSTETREQMVESNNGGRGFARSIQRLLDERKYRCSVKWFHQSQNKKARILTNAPIVQEYVIFPVDWTIRWRDFYLALMSYQKEGKNKHDDAPDALTGLVEHFSIRKINAIPATVALRL